MGSCGINQSFIESLGNMSISFLLTFPLFLYVAALFLYYHLWKELIMEVTGYVLLCVFFAFI